MHWQDASASPMPSHSRRFERIALGERFDFDLHQALNDVAR
jgi:hypothetical protein